MEANQGLVGWFRCSSHGRRLMALMAAGLFVGSLGGCYGRFPITNAIYRWNGRVTDNTVVNSIIMIVLAIIPVYGLAILIDAVIVNSIEFWDGERVDIAHTYQQPDGTTVVLAPGGAENEAVLTLWKDDAIVARRTFVRDDHGVTTVSDELGQVVSHVMPDGRGGFAFTGPTGDPIGGITAREIADLRAGSSGAVLKTGAGM